MFKLKTSVSLWIAIFFPSFIANAAEKFNLRALEIDSGTEIPDSLDFLNAGEQPEGTYRVDVIVNNQLVERRDIVFKNDSTGKLQPQLSIGQYKNYGLQISAIPAFNGHDDNEIVPNLAKALPSASVNFNFNKQQLTISIPQAVMAFNAQGSVAPSLWNDGITTLFSSYSATGAHSAYGNNAENTNFFLNLHNGFNWRGWRVRNYSTWNYSKSKNQTDSAWKSINTYVQHDLKTIRGKFTAGEIYTPSDLFDSVKLRGIQVESDDNMLADSQRGFAPTVRGIANSNAQVTITQNGVVIYKTYVPSGPFVIRDIYPTSLSGDLYVEVREADGSTRRFVQPFSSVPVMQREGHLKYGLSFGRYVSSYNGGTTPYFGQLSLIYGLPKSVTVYAGSQVSEKYNAFILGSGLSMGELGSFSFDATEALTQLRDDKKSGQSYRFQYSKDISSTDSTIALTGYRYSTKGFYTFQEANDQYIYSDQFQGIYNKKSKLQFDFIQNINNGDWGVLTISGYEQNYWNISGYEKAANIGYGASWGKVNWTMMYTYSKTPFNLNGIQADQRLSLNINIPIDSFGGHSYVNSSFNTEKNGKTSSSLGLGGTLLADNNLSYNVTENYANKGEGSGGSVNLDYRGTYGETSMGYVYGKDMHQINGSVQGAIFAHPYGVTLSQAISTDSAAMVLVKAAGVKNAKVLNNTGVYTDYRGYTIVPYATPYRRTRIALDPNSLGSNTDVDENVQNVIPNSGALVLAKFNAKIGSRVLFTLTHLGHSVPFGATAVLDGDKTVSSIVGEDGIAYFSGLPDKGIISVQWGKTKDRQCRASYDLTTVKGDLKQSKLECN